MHFILVYYLKPQSNVSQVIPDGQGFEKDIYNGSFRFRFWQFGDWVEVTIDDRLPTWKDKNKNNELCFGHSSDSNEFWFSLLEKAYSKLVVLKNK